MNLGSPSDFYQLLSHQKLDRSQINEVQTRKQIGSSGSQESRINRKLVCFMQGIWMRYRRFRLLVVSGQMGWDGMIKISPLQAINRSELDTHMYRQSWINMKLKSRKWVAGQSLSLVRTAVSLSMVKVMCLSREHVQPWRGFLRHLLFCQHAGLTKWTLGWWQIIRFEKTSPYSTYNSFNSFRYPLISPHSMLSATQTFDIKQHRSEQKTKLNTTDL